MPRFLNQGLPMDGRPHRFGPAKNTNPCVSSNNVPISNYQYQPSPFPIRLLLVVRLTSQVSVCWTWSFACPFEFRPALDTLTSKYLSAMALTKIRCISQREAVPSFPLCIPATRKQNKIPFLSHLG
jgi:hypothetical protein